MDILFGPAIFAERAMLLQIAILCPQHLPIHTLGDPVIGAAVTRLHKAHLSRVYRFLARASGVT